jgi:hypothetical protein
VEITVVMEEGVVLRRGSLVLAPSEEMSTVVLEPPFGTNFTPTRISGYLSDNDDSPTCRLIDQISRGHSRKSRSECQRLISLCGFCGP